MMHVHSFKRMIHPLAISIALYTPFNERPRSRHLRKFVDTKYLASNLHTALLSLVQFQMFASLL